jgi:uncharacterized protein YjbI with pentapeptide repeats
MKLGSPHLSARLESVGIENLLGGDLEDALLEDVDATNEPITALDMSSSRLERVTLTAAQCERVNARDVVVKGSDTSATNLSNGSWNRAEFVNCRMSGVDMNKTALHDVSFRGCKLDMANMRFSDLRRVVFVECSLTEADFLNARLVDVTFENCHLERVVFESVSCTRVDLRTSELIEIVGWKSLKGATIDTTQLVSAAPYLANELGLKVV